MTEPRTAHHDAGLRRLLNRAGAYDALQGLLLRKESRARYVTEHVRPFPGCRILDIGCGPGTILAHLPESIGRYTGFDMNPGYIEAARKRWGNRGIFHCQRIEAGVLPAGDPYDIVLANGILLTWTTPRRISYLTSPGAPCARGGWLVTYDNVYLENQHWFARWLIAHDRGRAVRSREGYEALAAGPLDRWKARSCTTHCEFRIRSS